MSDLNTATVVDSPIEMPTAENPGMSPIESLLEPKQVIAKETPVTDGIEPKPQQQPQQNDTTTAQAATEQAEEIRKLGEMVGRDLSRFKDVESAQAAADMIIEQYAAMGGEAGDDLAAVLQPKQPQVAQQPAAESDDLGLDETTVDPAVIAVLKKLQSQNKELKTQFTTAQQTQEAQQAQAVVQQVTQRAESYLDTLDSTVFGKNGKRSVAQNAAAQVVGSVAGNILRGAIAEARRTGRNSVPTIENIMAAAIKQTGFAVEKKAAAEPAKPKPHTLAPKSAAGAGKSAVTMPRISSGNDPYGIFSSPDPVIKAIWQEALNG